MALRTITISEEILFDYNDSQSAAGFLKQCPVCQQLGTASASTAEVGESVKDTVRSDEVKDMEVTIKVPSAAVAAAAAEACSIRSSSTRTPLGTTVTTITDSMPSTSSAKSPMKSVRNLSKADLATIMTKKTKLNRDERVRLYEEFSKKHPEGNRITRSMVEQWLPGINENCVDEIMRRRRKEIENAMIRDMMKSSKKRQQSILDKIKTQK